MPPTHSGNGGYGEAGGVGRGEVLGLCSGGNGGTGMGRRHRVPDPEAAVQESACYRVCRECLRELGPVRRAHKCTAGDIPQAPAVFVEVTRPPKVQGQDVWPVAPSNMWEAEQAAVMCRALQGQVAALPRAPAAQSSSNRPAASMALLHNGSRA